MLFVLVPAAALAATNPEGSDATRATPVSQDTQNTVTGVVTNDTGSPLPGARITVRGTGITVSTDRQGRYVLPNLTAGTATFEVSYLGLPQTTASVTVAARGVTVADIIVPSGTRLDEVVVVGSLTDGIARAMNQQRTADNTLNVVSADAIGRFPDTNIAEALQRLPGIGVERDQGEGNFISLRGSPAEFTSITVDGVSLPSSSPDTRAVDLGSLPSEVVNSLEVSKTLLPYQDADSIAGSVNLVTRSPFDSRRLRIRVNGGIGYNEMGGTNDERLSFVISDVFGPDKTFGALLSASYAQTDRRVDNIESVWDIIEDADGNDILGVAEQEFKDYETRRERLSVTGALEFRPDAVSRYFLRGTWGQRTDDEYRNLLAIVYEDGDILPGATSSSASFEDGRFIREFRHRIKRDESLSISAGGEHRFAPFSLDYTLSFSRSEETYPSRRQLVYRSGAAYDVSYDFSGDPDNPDLSLFTTQEHLNTANYGFRQQTDRWADTVQDEVAAAVNVTVPATLFGTNAEWRFGGRIRQREVSHDEERYRTRAGSASPGPLADMLSTDRSQNFDYYLGLKFDVRKALDYFEARRPLTVVPGNRLLEDSTVSDYTVDENVYAAYGMTRIEFARADLILGLRVERTEFEGGAFAYDLDIDDETGITENNVSRSYTDWFPNATLRYAFSDNLIGRASISRGIARPRYRDVVPRAAFEDDGAFVEVERGNPDLNPTLSNNFDAGLEYYFEPLGVVSAHVFYKDLTDYVFTFTTVGTYNGAPARISEVLNASDGHILGVELNYQQQFTFLPGFWSGFGLAANYTLTDAEMTLPMASTGRGSKVGLPNQSDTTLNLSAFYETERFNARLSWTDRSDFIQEFSSDPRLDIYWEGRSQLDFTASYDVADRVNVYFEAKNLTDSEGVRYAGDRSRPTERERFGYLLFSGIRVNF